MLALWQSERAVAAEKAELMSLTLSTAHALMSWLKDAAPSKVLDRDTTEPVCHELRGC